MFNLEKSIAEWRQQMLTAGIKTPVPLEELEIHLRDDIERMIKAGEMEQSAFETAREQLGRSSVLTKEFNKVKGDPRAWERKWMRIYCDLFPIFYSGMVACALLRMEMSFRLRISGFAALVLTCVFIWATQYFPRYLPAVSNKHRRLGIQIGCLFAWMICGGAVMNFVLPHLNLTPAQLTVIVLWLMMPIAAISGMSYGLNEAARRYVTSPVAKS